MCCYGLTTINTEVAMTYVQIKVCWALLVNGHILFLISEVIVFLVLEKSIKRLAYWQTLVCVIDINFSSASYLLAIRLIFLLCKFYSMLTFTNLVANSLHLKSIGQLLTMTNQACHPLLRILDYVNNLLWHSVVSQQHLESSPIQKVEVKVTALE